MDYTITSPSGCSANDAYDWAIPFREYVGVNGMSLIFDLFTFTGKPSCNTNK